MSKTQNKQRPRSKTEIAEDMKRVENTKRKRKIVKDQFYPILLETTKSIEDAKTFLQVLSISITQGFNNRKKTTILEDLKLNEMINPASPEGERYKAIYDLMAKENLMDALEMIDGMVQGIEGFQREESTKRPLSELKATFLD